MTSIGQDEGATPAPTAAAAAASRNASPAPGRKSAPSGCAVTVKGSGAARTQAGVILEVLAGVRTPQEAAEILGVSDVRYYQLESRALAGMVAGCEPRSRGPQVDYAEKWKRERAQVTMLTQEVTRLTALLRVAQQAYGVRPVPADRQRQAQAARKAGKRAKRKPSVRALKARARLEGSAAAPGAALGGDPQRERAVSDAAAGSSPPAS